MSLVYQGVPRDALAEVSRFPTELYACLTARGDALFELCNALLRSDGPVKTLVDLALAAEHRRGHGALYGGHNQGRIDVGRLRRAVTEMPSLGCWTVGWSWRWTSRRGCDRMPPHVRTGPRHPADPFPPRTT